MLTNLFIYIKKNSKEKIKQFTNKYLKQWKLF